jgi:hypothetical protein
MAKRNHDFDPAIFSEDFARLKCVEENECSTSTEADQARQLRCESESLPDTYEKEWNDPAWQDKTIGQKQIEILRYRMLNFLQATRDRWAACQHITPKPHATCTGQSHS